MQTAKAIVYIVDDDDSVRRAIRRLIRSAGMEVEAFASGGDFLTSAFRDQNVCIVADVRMPGMSGLELQRKLVERGLKLPVILITGYHTAATRNQAKKIGAFGYFKKSVDDQDLLDTIRWALNPQS